MAAIEKHHEERYRALLRNVEAAVFRDKRGELLKLIQYEEAPACWFAGRGKFQHFYGCIIPNGSHCDLYDGGKGNYIPFDKLGEPA